MGMFRSKKEKPEFTGKIGPEASLIKKEKTHVDKKTEIPGEKISEKKPKEKAKKEVKKEVKLETAKSIFVEKTLCKPWISEKTNLMASEGKYVFKVSRSASKNAVKDAIESLYKVLVGDVNMINIPQKPKRFKGKNVFRSKYRKAVITLKEGETIEVF